ncbi:DUF1801 domain-containing protein [Jiulongibacter sediminis]|uniref:DUF1801 domain-containing protein n=1 Tax=Jiulongibacter sediminis TaxID=1605367 RepID=UPI0009E887A3|nr:YdeI/OmpD-associated family protein [Jiulongibacter sediminis]
MDPKVEAYISNAKYWSKELQMLSGILQDCGLEEVFKWRAPCYMEGKKNVIITGEFKDGCVLSFLKGVLLKDEHQLLQKPGENSQSARYVKFTSTKEIAEKEAIIKAYIFEAIEIEKAGLKPVTKAKNNLTYPDELLEKFEEKPSLKEAFEKLTPGRQRAYLIHFTGAKQSKTVFDRIDKYTPRILRGFGFNDCVCGHSKRMPNCDGSHKNYDPIGF